MGIIDCKMHIGDEVFVHGYIDEIRNDTIIIRNVGGYFGTSRDEVFYYEKNGYGTMNEADTLQTEVREICDRDGNCSECWKELHCRAKDTSQTDSEITRNSLRSDCMGCRFVGWYDTEFPCVNCVRKNKDYYDSK